MSNFVDAPTDAGMLQLVSTIYAAALRPDGWRTCLDDMRSMFGLPYVAHMTRTDDFSRRYGMASGATQAEYDDMLDTFFTSSVYLKSPFPFFTGQVAASRDMASKPDVLGSDIYQGWNKQRDVHEMLRLVLRSQGGVSKLITLARPWSAGPFSSADVRMCQILMPHLQAATAMAERLEGADLLAQAALSGLDLLHHAVLLLDPAARVFHTNRAADGMLASGCGIKAVRGVLQTTSLAQTERLQASLARALGRTGLPRASYLRMPRLGSSSPLVVLVMPIQAEASWAVLQRPAIMVCITDPDRTAHLPRRQMTELFGLTPAEASLADDLLAGYDLRDIADRQGRSINTVRTHLARLMAKTDVNKQGKLLQLLATIPRAE